MAEKAGFPQIPRPVWFGVRAIFNKSLGRKLDENGLAAALNVQPSAAKQYLTELRRVGLITDDGAATDLAAKWRQNEQYADAVGEILKNAYPQSLIDLAPVGHAERAAVERWFKNHGLGEGTARNKAATYLMIANANPDSDAVAQPTESQRKPRERGKKDDEQGNKKGVQNHSGNGGQERGPAPETFPLNVNVQIHISAEASTDQIEAIFSSMRKNLYGGGATG